MRIDWFTLVAQVVNFLILVLLLRRFLYRPIIEAIDRRRSEIRGRLGEAEEARERARRAEAQAREAREALDRQRADRLAEIEREVEEAREAMLEEARREAGESRESWRRAIERERASFLAELRERARKHTYEAVRRALEHLANERLEEHAIDAFLSSLDAMDEVDRNGLRDAARRADRRLLVRSRFEIPEGRRERIAEAARALVGPDATVRFETAPEIGWGVELRAGDHKVGWSVDSYLDVLEEEVAEVLEAEAGEAASVARPFAEVAPEETPEEMPDGAPEQVS